jgi:hypothetical protein
MKILTFTMMNQGKSSIDKSIPWFQNMEIYFRKRLMPENN